jgi:hypothetical protein
VKLAKEGISWQLPIPLATPKTGLSSIQARLRSTTTGLFDEGRL